MANIIKHQQELNKYGELNYIKIRKKLSACPPAINLLFLVGFTKSKQETRLQWIHTNTNLQILTKVYKTLIAILNNNNNNNNDDENNHNLLITIKQLTTYKKLINNGIPKEKAIITISIQSNGDENNNVTQQKQNSASSKEWNCNICTFNNINNLRVCEMCGVSRSGSIDDISIDQQAWSCSKCTYINKLSSKTKLCGLCGYTEGLTINSFKDISNKLNQLVDAYSNLDKLTNTVNTLYVSVIFCAKKT